MSLRIAVCNSQIPFAYGGAEILADSLVEQLRLRGHGVDLVRLPLRWYPQEEVLKSYLAWRLINLEESEGRTIDRVVALKFPSFVVKHPYKVTWLVHQFRQAYDLFGTEFSHLTSSPADSELRRTICEMDTRTLSESRCIFADARNTADRLFKYNGLKSEVLYAPPALDGRYHNAGYGDYVFSISRLDRLKRVDQLITAMAHVRTPVQCRIAGRGEQLPALMQLAKRVDVARRVTFLDYVSDEDALEQYAKALAVYYAPFDEDYGLATVEAMKAQKPVLSTTGSGGVLEFVEEGVTGFVTPAGDALALAQRIDQLYLDKQMAERLGTAGQQRVAGITWDAAIRKLLEA